MRLRSIASFVGLLAVVSATSVVGCGSREPENPEADFDADWTEDFENDLEEDAAQQAEQAEVDEVDDLDDPAVLEEDFTEDTATAPSPVSKATRKPPRRPPHGPISILQDDPWFSGEHSDDKGHKHFDFAAAAARQKEAKALGADVVRIMLWWSHVAPEPKSLKKPEKFHASLPTQSEGPTYDWRYLDSLIEGARANGLKVLVTITAGSMPYWASEEPEYCKKKIEQEPDPKKRWWSCSWKPSPKEYAKFVTAVGRHVKAKKYRIWGWTFVNEPNIPAFLSDEDRAVDRDDNSAMEVAFRYRRLWFAARKHLRKTAKLPRQRILYSDQANNEPDKNEVLKPSSRRWNLFPWSLCLKTEWNPDLLDGSYKCPQRPRKVHVSGVAFHPYTSSPEQGIASVEFLQKLLDDAAQEGRIGKNRGLYMTEAGFLTAKKGNALGSGIVVTPNQQAVYLNRFEQLLHENKRVKSLAQYELLDEGRGSWDCGLRFAWGNVHLKDGGVVTGNFVEMQLESHIVVQNDAGTRRIGWAEIGPPPWNPDPNAKGFYRTGPGAEKPAYAAYRIAIVGKKEGDKIHIWGHARPDTGGGFSIEALTPSGWIEVTTVDADVRGYGQKTIPIGTATAWRIRWGGEVSREIR